MILHIVPDDKFIDMAYNMFEKASPNNNEFMVVTKQKKFIYIKTTPITIVSPIKFLSQSFAKSLKKYDFIVIHWMDDLKKQLIINAPKSVRFVWIGWGGDYYNYINKNLFLQTTANLMKNVNLQIQPDGFLTKIKRNIKELLFLKDIKDFEKVLHRLSYFAPVLHEDYLLVKNSFNNFNPQYLDWNYGTLEDDFIKQDLNISGKNILLGNSATFENNHIEAIDLLCKLDLENRKVICPLSYGLEEYAKEVINYGSTTLGDKFKYLINFMKIEEYNQIISTCSIVVMNHLRQQALGNIVIMLYFGAKVFLNKENPVYEFFKNNGAVIFSMEELTDKNIDIGLTEQDKNTNKEVLKKYWTRDVMLEKTKNLIETMRKINA